MRVPRLFVSVPIQPNATLILPEANARHLITVLRRKEGDPLQVFDGSGLECEACVKSISKRRTEIAVQASLDLNLESPLKITLAQGIAKSDKMDWIIQKAVELGVSSIQPLFTDRTVVRLDEKRIEKRLIHWQGVSISATEQCGRNILTPIHSPVSLKEWFASRTADSQGMILHPGSASRLSELKIHVARPLDLLIGPEGGLSPDEREQAVLQGFYAVRLGPRIMRTETASIAALGQIQALWGDI